MSDFPLHPLMLACGSLLLLGISMASATAQYLRWKQAAFFVVVKRPALR